jgi:hypothetical protein
MLASLLPLWAAYSHRTALNDDTYITLTYVKNIARGDGFVFNAQPPTLGTTTPLTTLAVAALAIPIRSLLNAINLSQRWTAQVQWTSRFSGKLTAARPTE